MTPKKKDNEQPETSFWRRYALWLVVPLMLALYYSQDNTVYAELKQRQILPALVQPTHYNLNLTPDLDTFIYQGIVKIDLDVLNQTNTIVLNANELVVREATIMYNNNSYSAVHVVYDNKTEQVSLVFDATLNEKTQVQLEIDFQGFLNDHMSGFYRSSFKDQHGDTKYLATTQFEATDARRAFPCWDEPSLKATFDVTLNVPSHLTALSNMNVISEKETSQGLKTVKYATTPRMSTYLLAFIVGPFEYIEAYTSGEYNERPIRTRVYTLPGLSKQGHHALNVATETLEYFAKVFGLVYPLPKLDLIAIPDFDAGAMENWGLVTFRTTALLYDEENSAFNYKRSTAYTVAHELAHQWFGNLVTMEWWDHLWLNEGFATWVGWLAVDHIFPDWQVWTMFSAQEMQTALGLDGLRSSHPIQVAVNNPAEIHQIFDSISYLKGASVIRMVNAWLSTHTFLAGIHEYLKEHRLGNAATSDLWRALGQESGKNVSEFMNTWTQETGYPVINVTLMGEDKMLVTQSRYLLTGDLKQDEDSVLWWIPLRVQVPGKVEPFTLREKNATFSVPKHAPLKLNQGQTSLYRVNYSKELMSRLIHEIKKPDNGILSEPTDRAGLLSDLGVLCRSGEQITTTFLEAANAFKDEKNFFVLTELSTQLMTVKDLYGENPNIQSRLNDISLAIFSPLVSELGWKEKAGEPELNKLLRPLVIGEAGLAGNPKVIAEAKQRFEQFIQGNHDAISPDLKSVVYRILLQHANPTEEEKVWQAIFDIYNNESFPMDQRVIALSSLGTGIQNKTVIQKTMDLILDEQNVRTQDAHVFFRSLGTNTFARHALIDFFQQNYDAIYQRFSKSMGALGNSINNLVSGIHDADEIQHITTFFNTKDTSQYTRGLNSGLEKAKVNAAQILREYNQMINWAK